MLTKEKRSARIGALEQTFKDASGIFLTDITRITVAQVTRLRVDFRVKNVKYIVVKNTLARIAAERSGKKELAGYFKGPVGVAVSYGDPTTPAKVIRDFRKEFKDLLEVRVAYVDGTLYGRGDIEKLADVPSREVLLGQLLGCLQAPLATLAGTLQGVIGTFAGTLEAVKNLKQAQQSRA